MLSWSLVLDVDGVLTDGHMLYSREGKEFKIFGPDDASALKFLAQKMKVSVISADRRGFDITHRRVVEDMHLSLTYVSEQRRAEFIRKEKRSRKIAFMADSFTDCEALAESDLAICPSNACESVKRVCHIQTATSGGNRAVAAAAFALNHYLNLEIQELSVESIDDFIIERDLDTLDKSRH